MRRTSRSIRGCPPDSCSRIARGRTRSRHCSSSAKLEAEVVAAGASAVKVDDKQLAAFLEQAGRIVRVGDGLAVSRALYDRGVDVLPALTPITLAGFRDALGASRKTAQLLLERFDADGLTRRVGDERVLRRGATTSQS
jgi:selenocysteine-specific elongation factor